MNSWIWLIVKSLIIFIFHSVLQRKLSVLLLICYCLYHQLNKTRKVFSWFVEFKTNSLSNLYSEVDFSLPLCVGVSWIKSPHRSVRNKHNDHQTTSSGPLSQPSTFLLVTSWVMLNDISIPAGRALSLFTIGHSQLKCQWCHVVPKAVTRHCTMSCKVIVQRCAANYSRLLPLAAE